MNDTVNVVEMKIKNVKSIKNVIFNIPLTPGLYAITGENGAGKSTLVSCAAGLFMEIPMRSYFGSPYNGSYIAFNHKEENRKYLSENRSWKRNPTGKIDVNGFFEGSITFGKRFVGVDFNKLKKASNIDRKYLAPASDFVKENLGEILKNNKSYYDSLSLLIGAGKSEYKLKKNYYYYWVNGQLVNQLLMSTGENLLISILDSLKFQMEKYEKSEKLTPTIIILDEVEFAIHSSALRRLIHLLQELSVQYNFTIIFSTHSIELIRNIEPSNIFYVQRNSQGDTIIEDSCYPAYVTRNLESSRGGFDFVILVEDELAKKMVEKILVDQRLLAKKKVTVIPVGGYAQVIQFAYDAISSNLMLHDTKILMILDQDIKEDAANFMKKEKINFTNGPMYLPIKSIEKYLLDNLVKSSNQQLFRLLDDYVFQSRPVSHILQEYETKLSDGTYKQDDSALKNGKKLYTLLKSELKQIRKPEDTLIGILVDHLNEYEKENIAILTKELENLLTAQS